MPPRVPRSVTGRTTNVTLLLAATLAVGAAFVAAADAQRQAAPFSNAYPADGDTGLRAPARYFLRRAWVQLTRNMAATPLPDTVALDIGGMAVQPFTAAWIGHASLLVRAGDVWIMTDPMLSDYATPVPPFGPKRLTPLPIDPDDLPHIDFVLISHDHYDHLDLPTLRRLARQPGGPPRFLAGRGLSSWFQREVGIASEDFDWWQSTRAGALGLTFVPAQHSSGRGIANKNHTLWGGWVIEHDGRRLYFAGDTAFSAPMFRDIRERAGPIDFAALPIGAYRPREWMRFEHLDPAEALQAHIELGARRSLAIHWATFQLGDEEPITPSLDLAAALRARGIDGFDIVSVGGTLAIPAAGHAQILTDAGSANYWGSPASMLLRSASVSSDGRVLSTMESSSRQRR